MPAPLQPWGLYSPAIMSLGGLPGIINSPGCARALASSLQGTAGFKDTERLSPGALSCFCEAAEQLWALGLDCPVSLGKSGLDLMTGTWLCAKCSVCIAYLQLTTALPARALWPFTDEKREAVKKWCGLPCWFRMELGVSFGMEAGPSGKSEEPCSLCLQADEGGCFRR